MNFRRANLDEIAIAIEIIESAKRHFKKIGIDQWQRGYPDYACIEKDLIDKKGYFVLEGSEIIGYLCIDFDGESAYDDLNGEWEASEDYVLVHRMVLLDNARDKGLSRQIFKFVEDLAKKRGIDSFRIDTEGENERMRYVLEKNGFTYRGTIWFDGGVKVAYDKRFKI